MRDIVLVRVQKILACQTDRPGKAPRCQHPARMGTMCPCARCLTMCPFWCKVPGARHGKTVWSMSADVSAAAQIMCLVRCNSTWNRSHPGTFVLVQCWVVVRQGAPLHRQVSHCTGHPSWRFDTASCWLCRMFSKQNHAKILRRQQDTCKALKQAGDSLAAPTFKIRSNQHIDT